MCTYSILLRVFVLPFVMAGAAAPLQGQKIEGWGEPIDPVKDCTFSLDGKALLITVPGFPARELRAFPGTRNAPRVLRDIESNFAVTVHVAGNFSQTAADAQPDADRVAGAGLLLWLDEVNFVRLERAAIRPKDSTQPRSALVVEYWKDGRVQDSATITEGLPLEGDSSWLRLTRRIDKIKVEISGDGQNWSEAKSITVRLSSRMRLGVLATNTTGQPLNVRFENFGVKAVTLAQ